jgi:hypothetical protein
MDLPTLGLNWPTALAVYAVWFAATFNLKSSPPDSLPAWPCWLIFWPPQQFLRLLGNTQRTVFSEPLDPVRRYLVCCSPHGAYALSGLIWVRAISKVNCSATVRDQAVHCFDHRPICVPSPLAHSLCSQFPSQIAPQLRLQTLPEYQKLRIYFGGASSLFYIPLLREALLLAGLREVRLQKKKAAAPVAFLSPCA